MTPIVSAEWLRDNATAVRIVDLRWYLDGRSGREAYRAGHLAGAVFVDLQSELTSPAGPGRHPIPAADPFTAAMQRAGVDADRPVVAYDDAGGAVAARLWWLLRYYGHPAVAVLDGGIAAWSDPLETGEPASPPRGRFVARTARTDWTVDREEVLRSLGRAILLDARAPERYRGEVEPIDRAPDTSPAHAPPRSPRTCSTEGLRLPTSCVRTTSSSGSAGAVRSSCTAAPGSTRATICSRSSWPGFLPRGSMKEVGRTGRAIRGSQPRRAASPRTSRSSEGEPAASSG